MGEQCAEERDRHCQRRQSLSPHITHHARRGERDGREWREGALSGEVASNRLRKNYCGTVEIQWPAHLGQARSIWSVWFIWSIWFNQTNQTDRIDQMDKTGWRTFSASC